MIFAFLLENGEASSAISYSKHEKHGGLLSLENFISPECIITKSVNQHDFIISEGPAPHQIQMYITQMLTWDYESESKAYEEKNAFSSSQIYVCKTPISTGGFSNTGF